MKRIRKIYLPALIAFVLSAGGCKENKLGIYPVPDKGPDITDLVVQNNSSELHAPGELSYSLRISDKYTLSTLDVSVETAGAVIASRRHIIYKSGNTHIVDNETMEIPLLANMPDGAQVEVKFLATSVPGGETLETVALTLKRPAVERLFMFLNGAVVGHEMTRDAANANLFTIAKADGSFYPSIFDVKFADGATLDDASLIWAADPGDPSAAAIGSADDESIKGSFPTTVVESIGFDIVTFELTVEGEEVDFAIDGTPLLPADASLSGALLYARVEFTQGQEVLVTGLTEAELEGAYNRDFFEYDDGTLTFLRESGEWDVYYSTDYNYFWIRRDDAVGPEGFWVVGQGFFAPPASAGYAFLTEGDWTTNDVIFNNYIVKTGENTYQTTMYVIENHQYGFEFQFFSDLAWSKAAGIEIHSAADISGDTEGFLVYDTGDYGLYQGVGFEGGYYRFEFDLSGTNATCVITHLD